MRVDLGRIRGRSGGEYDQNALYAHTNFFKNKGIILNKEVRTTSNSTQMSNLRHA